MKTKFGIEIPFEVGKNMTIWEAVHSLVKLCTDLAEAVDTLQAEIDELKSQKEKS